MPCIWPVEDVEDVEDDEDEDAYDDDAYDDDEDDEDDETLSMIGSLSNDALENASQEPTGLSLKGWSSLRWYS